MLMAVQCVTTSTSTADDSCASSSSASASDIGSLVNLEAFPIEDVSHPFLAAARTALFETGVASFPDFLRPAAVAAAAGEATLASPTAFVTDSEHNAWQTERNTSLPADHLANLFMRTRVASVATDEIGPTLKRLYEAISHPLLAPRWPAGPHSLLCAGSRAARLPLCPAAAVSGGESHARLRPPRTPCSLPTGLSSGSMVTQKQRTTAPSTVCAGTNVCGNVRRPNRRVHHQCLSRGVSG